VEILRPLALVGVVHGRSRALISRFYDRFASSILRLRALRVIFGKLVVEVGGNRVWLGAVDADGKAAQRDPAQAILAESHHAWVQSDPKEGSGTKPEPTPMTLLFQGSEHEVLSG